MLSHFKSQCNLYTRFMDFFLSIIIKLPSPSINPDTQLLFCILLTGNRGRVVNLTSEMKGLIHLINLYLEQL